MSVATMKPLGLQTIRVHIDAIDSAPLLAIASLPDFPDHPIRISRELIHDWGIPFEEGTDFWIHGDVTGWPEDAIEFQRHPEQMVGTGELPKGGA